MFTTSHIRTVDTQAEAAELARQYMNAQYCENVDAVALIAATEYMDYTEPDDQDPRRVMVVEIRDTSAYIYDTGTAPDVGTALADFLTGDGRGYFRDYHILDVLDRVTQ